METEPDAQEGALSEEGSQPPKHHDSITSVVRWHDCRQRDRAFGVWSVGAEQDLPMTIERF